MFIDYDFIINCRPCGACSSVQLQQAADAIMSQSRDQLRELQSEYKSRQEALEAENQELAGRLAALAAEAGEARRQLGAAEVRGGAPCRRGGQGAGAGVLIAQCGTHSVRNTGISCLVRVSFAVH